MSNPNQHRTTDRPQGFQRAQMAKRGLHDCQYECGLLFPTQARAKRHANSCPKKVEVFGELQMMAERRGFVDQREIDKQAEAEKRKSDHKRFIDFLNKLPDINRLELLDEDNKKADIL